MGVAAKPGNAFGNAVIQMWGEDLPLSVLARRAGIEERKFYRIVSEGQEPKLAQIQAIASALGVTVDELVRPSGGAE